MSKIYKSWELMKAISDGEIKKGTKFKDKDKKEVEWDGNNFVYIDSYRNYMSVISDIYFINEEFELIEDGIDIDSIKEMELDVIDDVTYYINDLIKTVKQIDKRVKKLEEK